MHKAKACILSCIDFRFQEQIHNWLEENGYMGKSDLIDVAGASRDLVAPIKENHKKALMREIELSVNLHDPDEIIIIDHQDCGGYAQDGTIPSGLSKKEDIEMHLPYIEDLDLILAKKFLLYILIDLLTVLQ